MKEFNLSERIEKECGSQVLYLKDVKEFIQRLKAKSKQGWEGYKGLVHIDEILKLAGEKLK